MAARRVDWRHGADHMWANHKVTVVEADEALADVDALWFDPDPKSKSGTSVRVIGYCASRGEILTIILVREPGVSWLWVQMAGRRIPLIVRSTVKGASER